MARVCSLSEAVRELVHDGDTVALEGFTHLIPFAAGHEVIRQRRLLDAKRLLSHSEMSVSEIGYHLGFEDPSYFSRFFRRYERCAPAEFREQIREKYP